MEAIAVPVNPVFFLPTIADAVIACDSAGPGHVCRGRLHGQRKQIIDRAAEHRLPAIYEWKGLPKASD